MSRISPIITFEGGPVYYDALPIIRSDNADIVIDDNSVIDGLYSLKCTSLASGGVAVFPVPFSISVDSFFFQFSLKLSSDFALETDEIALPFIFSVLDGSTAFTLGIVNDSGNYRLQIGGMLSDYTVPVNLSVNTLYNIQFGISIHPTSGQFAFWINNNDFENPDYSVDSIDTGSDDIVSFYAGIVTFTNDLTGHYFLDNIGAFGDFQNPFNVPHRLTNLNDVVYDPLSSNIIYAEHINSLLDTLRP